MTGATVTTQLDADNPWPGLESFEENAQAFFFGRDREAASLLNHVRDAPVTVLYGRSGLGKTSLLQAGLFPLLREENFLPVYARFELMPGAAPLARQLHQSVRNSIRADVPDAMLPSDDASLWEYLHRADVELRNAQNRPLTPVIVVDQFEELFTLGERVPDLVTAFMNDLGDLAENRIPADLAARIEDDETVAARFQLRSDNYKLLISLREEFLAALEKWRVFVPALGRSRMRLLRLRAEDAFDAVHTPASHLTTDELAHRVVRIVAGKVLHGGRDTAWPEVDRPGEDLAASDVEPALLSLFCRELNEERKRRGQPQFDEQLIEDAKRDILSNYYASCMRDLDPRVAEFIESELITEKGFRDRYAREDAVPSRLTDDELARLIDSGLVRLVDHYGGQWIQLTHDVLTGVVREHRDRRRAEVERAALVFVSYSRADEPAVRSLVGDLQQAGVRVWLDEELGGGEAWWTAILDQIRACSVFVFALSDKSLKSKPCRAELDYATALGIRVLPVQIGAVKSYRTDTLFSKQYVDYRDSTENRFIDLVAVLRELSGLRGELPEPLPEAPQIPYEYLQRLGAAIRGSADLDRSAQAAIVFELRSALDVEEDDTVRVDIRELLQLLRDRSDVVYPIVKEIDSIS